MAHESGDKQRPAKRRHVQGMLDEKEPLSTPTPDLSFKLNNKCCPAQQPDFTYAIFTYICTKQAGLKNVMS